jgi:hypothetical protein
MEGSSVAHIRVGRFVAAMMSLAALAVAAAMLRYAPPPADTASALQRYYPQVAPTQPTSSGSHGVISELPATFNTAMRVKSGGVEVAVRPLDAQDSVKSVSADGSLVYANAFGSADVAYRETPGKTEEFLYIREPAERGEWSWEMTIGALRPVVLQNGAVEFVDPSNMPKMQISAPEGKDATGEPLRCGGRLSIKLDELPAGRARLTLSADLRGLKFPVAIDPSWSSIHAMGTSRADHTATLLPSGKVLVCGGSNSSGALNTAELYNPATDTWTPTATTMNSKRFNHIAILLSTNKVLIAGGNDGSVDLASSEIYDPVLDTFTLTGPMNNARQLARGVTLLDNTVLVVGGGVSPTLKSSEVYDPVGGTWTLKGNLNSFRALCTATLLPTGPNQGKVLIAGGTADGGVSFLNTAEMYDPTLGTFATLASNMITGRFKHQAILVGGGTGVLMVGGFNSGLFPSAEIYSLAGNNFNPTGSLTKARTEHRIMNLLNGKILAVGCHDGSFAQVDLYDAATATWNLTGSTLTPHTRHAIEALSDGRVMVIGGFVGGFLSASELYDPASEPVNQSIAANASNPLAITLQAVTVDDAGVTFPAGSITQPANGLLSGTAPNLVYTSTGGYSGPDSFTFKSTDSFGLSKVGTVNITVNSLVPTITQTSPDAAINGSPGFTLNITGTNFVHNSLVKWNGAARPTTFISTTQLQAVIPASDVAVAGTANLTIFNPIPGGGTSAIQPFSVLGGQLGQWIVTNTNDSGTGSLRMAMNDARSGDSIIFDTTVFNLVNSNAATVINVLSPLPLMDKGSVTIDASNVRVTVNGSGAGSSNGLQIVSNNNTVLGLTLVGFTKDGILISSANGNIIGGNRTLPAIGTGPNGQGLRISGCGAFGIEIGSGNQNVIKGCWIGVDASGSASQPNLAGILIQTGGSSNQVGSTVADEANVISGNLYEGVTVSGTGTNNNLVMGNVVGASAQDTGSRSVSTRDVGDLGDTLGGRSAVGNGSAGVFLSKGTNGTQVGGDTGQGNAIGNNGGNGVEVRANSSKFNTSKHNGISKNHRGGIALFDGSNNGILPPVFDIVFQTAISGRATGDSVGIHVEGHASNDGAVEIFNDSEDQGGSLLGRTSCVGGIWRIDTTSSSSMNLTATLTDTAGNTSSFSLFGPPPAFPTPVITSPLTVSAVAGISFAYTITAGGATPITFQAADLPDGLTLNGNLISGTPTTAGTYMVHITASNSAGSVSSTLVIAVVSSFSMDSDGDGVPDFLESLAGTDPSQASSVPLQAPLSVDKAQFKLVPTGAGDFVSLTLRLTLPTGFTSVGGTANVQVGNIFKTGLKFPIKAAKSTTALIVKASKTSGAVVATFNIRGEDLKAGLAGFGFTDQTTDATGTTLTVPVAIALTANSTTYVAGAQIHVVYKAKKGKGGSAKK